MLATCQDPPADWKENALDGIFRVTSQCVFERAIVKNANSSLPCSDRGGLGLSMMYVRWTVYHLTIDVVLKREPIMVE
jgi:hypothetical protein